MSGQFNLEQHRKLEEETHQVVHECLCRLMVNYEPSSDLKHHFKKGMFVKSNPGAFLHIMQFLLNIIDPIGFKSHCSWPLYDKVMETKFKSDLRAYLSDLDKKFPLAGLGPIRISYMVTPGGYQFTDFLMNLSNLAMLKHLQNIGKNPFVPTGDNSERDQTILLQEIEKTSSRITALAIVGNQLYEEDLKEKELIKNKIENVDKKISKQKKNWKSHILLIPNLSQEERCALINDPGSVVSKLKSQLLEKLNDVENLNQTLSKSATFYKEIKKMTSLILERCAKGHCLQYDDELKNLMDLRKYVAVENIPVVDQIVANDTLELPILLRCLKSAFDQIKPMMPQTESDVDAITSINESIETLYQTVELIGDLNIEVLELKAVLQKSLEEAREKFEKKPFKDDSPMTSLAHFWPDPSPCRNLKWFKNNSDRTIPNLKEARTLSMIDMSKISRNSKRTYQPDWFKPTVTTVRNLQQKASKNSCRKYVSTPCLSSPPVPEKKLNLGLDLKTPNKKSYDKGSLSFKLNSTNSKESFLMNEPSTDKATTFSTPSGSKTPTFSITKEPRSGKTQEIPNMDVPTSSAYDQIIGRKTPRISKTLTFPFINLPSSSKMLELPNEATSSPYDNVLGIKSPIDKYVTPKKPTRRSLIDAKVAKRLSCVADEMPIPNLGSYTDKSCNNSVNFSPLGYKSPDISIGKLVSSIGADGKKLYNRFSLGPLLDDCTEDLANISEDRLSIDFSD